MLNPQRGHINYECAQWGPWVFIHSLNITYHVIILLRLSMAYQIKENFFLK